MWKLVLLPIDLENITCVFILTVKMKIMIGMTDVIIGLCLICLEVHEEGGIC